MKLNSLQHRVSNSKCNFLFFNFELVTRKWNKKSLTFKLGLEVNFLIFWLRVNNMKCNFFLLEIELVTRSDTFYFSTLS